MEKFLDNPVYFALISGNADMAKGTDEVKYFEPEISPFAGFAIDHNSGFDILHNIIESNRIILFASRTKIEIPIAWKLIRHIPGSQFVYTGKHIHNENFENLEPLNAHNVDEMVKLAALTKPGPFDLRTIEFGNYYGVFENNKLVAMAGHRLKVYNYIEISAVCTHPDYLGKGYAGKLLSLQVNSILAEDKTPFLHVRSDNERAIYLYKKLGFEHTGDMHFYLVKKNR